MFKRVVSFVVMVILLFSLVGCNKEHGDFGVKPEGFDEAMPQIWEEELSGKEFDLSGIVLETATEITIGADITNIAFYYMCDIINLENIYVEEGNEVFASEDGVLYSRSFQTLYKWPPKKPVTTTIKDTVKYFASYCFYGCDIPNDFDLPDGTISLGYDVFAFSNLKNLHIKENVRTVVGQNYPVTCEKIEISAPIVYASFYAQYNESNIAFEGFKTIIFNEGVKQIRAENKWEREYRSRLKYSKNIIFPSTLEAIGDVSFPVNVCVASYVIPESVVYFGKYAFDDYYVERSFWAKIGIEKDKPLDMPRIATTILDSKSQLSKDYINSKKSLWEKNKKKEFYAFGNQDLKIKEV